MEDQIFIPLPCQRRSVASNEEIRYDQSKFAMQGKTMNRWQGMTAIRSATKYLGLAGLLLVFGCNRTQQPAAANQVADEAAVRQTDENWSKAAQSKKVDDWVAYYSDDAVVLPPNEKKASGKEDVRKEIGELISLPGLALSWKPAKVEVSLRRLGVYPGELPDQLCRFSWEAHHGPGKNPRDMEEANGRQLEMYRGHVELRSSGWPQ